MMFTAVLASLSLLSVGQDSLPSTLPLGSYTIGTTPVEAKVYPGQKPELLGTSFTYNGDTYIVDYEGRVVARTRGNGSWQSIADRLRKAKDNPPTEAVWRMKAFVLTRSDLLETHSNGMLRVRRGSIEGPQMQRTMEALAILSALIESTTDGAVKPKIDLQLDAESVPENASAGSKPFGEKFLQDYLQARINGAGYLAEDRAYRGPYDSVFVIHAGLVQDSGYAVINDSPSWSVPCYSPDTGGSAQDMALYLFRLWNRDVLTALAKHGYRTVTDADFVGPQDAMRTRMLPPVPAAVYAMPNGQWGKIGNALEATSESYIKHAAPSYKQEGFAWSEVRESPLDHLPWLTGRVELGKTLGISSVWANDLGIKPRTQASFSVDHGTDQYMFVDLTFADLFGSHFPETAKARALALYGDSVFKRVYVIFRTEKFPDMLPEVSHLKIPNFTFGPDVTPSSPAELPVFGNLDAFRDKDSEHGDVWRLQLRANPWLARLDLVPPGMELKLAKQPFFTLTMRALEAQPWTIGLYTAGASRPSARICLYAALPEPVETVGGEQIPTMVLPGFKAPDWSSVTVDLRQILDASTLERITQIRLETDPRSPCFEPIRPASTAWVARPILREAGTATPLQPLPGLPAPMATSGDPEARLSYIVNTRNWTDPEAKTNLLALLDDSDDGVRLNACNVLTKVSMSGCEPKLNNALRSINTRIAEYAAKALAFQNTAEGWLGLGVGLDSGPFEYTRAWSAKMLATRQDPKLAGTMSTLFVSRSWRVRQAGAEALLALPGNESAVAAMAFLQEDDPAVRLAVVQGVRLNLDLVLRRLLWSAVNDSSDAVRAASDIGLIKLGKPNHIAEGYKGIRDDSRTVRLALVKYIERNPSEAGRDALRLAVTDTDADIRAAALDAFIRMPGPFSPEHVQSAANDLDPRVQAAYKRLMAAKGP